MTASSVAALVTLRALVGGGADVDTPEARRAAIYAVAVVADEANKRLLLGLIEASFVAIIVADATGCGKEDARKDLLMTLDWVETAGRRR